jgi:hypothetical protein
MKRKTFYFFAGCLAAALLAGFWFASGPSANDSSLAEASLEKPETEVAATSHWRLALNASIHWEQRIHAVRQLSEPLPLEALNELLAFLHTPPAGKLKDWYLVVNEIMEVLRKRNLAPERYAKEMLSLIKDGQADPVIRDYAAQTLAQWISGRDASGGQEKDPQLATQVLDDMLAEAVKPTNGQLTLVGTTLQALTDTVINGHEMMRAQQNKVSQLAITLAAGRAGLATVNQTAAIQSCVALEVPELPQLCRQLLTDAKLKADLRLSAVAALGQVGSASDAALLQTFSEDVNCHYAVKAALSRLALR